jgi:hypothetical protein
VLGLGLGECWRTRGDSRNTRGESLRSGCIYSSLYGKANGVIPGNDSEWLSRQNEVFVPAICNVPRKVARLIPSGLHAQVLSLYSRHRPAAHTERKRAKPDTSPCVFSCDPILLAMCTTTFQQTL